MKGRELLNLGVPEGHCKRVGIECVKAAARAGHSRQEMREQVAALVRDPAAFEAAPHFAPLAKAMIAGQRQEAKQAPKRNDAPWKQWGSDIDPNAIDQIKNACRLPIAVRGALMPDAHVGYGLPIGGVLATENAVIPYAVGVDIACRMKMTVLDMPLEALDTDRHRLKQALGDETRFGIGAEFKKNRRRHDVLDADWHLSPITWKLRDKAWAQLGTSGSGNHFVEYGVLTIEVEGLDIPPGEYLALLSHSGSRGTGAAVCAHYSKIAMEKHRNLDKSMQHLAWLDLDTHEGREYWAAMELMGEYAAANHACIHRHIAEHLGVAVLLDVENHHNFAWKEEHDGREVIVHRKGATPAGEGVLGIIPGSMATPGFLVRGKGSRAALDSAAHGAGRHMSRTQAKKTLNWHAARQQLEEAGVELISAGLDEVPGVYKDIHSVMAAQRDLVEILARFDPKVVKMAPPGERPED